VERRKSDQAENVAMIRAEFFVEDPTSELPQIRSGAIELLNVDPLLRLPLVKVYLGLHARGSKSRRTHRLQKNISDKWR
jgi:hypothetical protein